MPHPRITIRRKVNIILSSRIHNITERLWRWSDRVWRTVERLAEWGRGFTGECMLWQYYLCSANLWWLCLLQLKESNDQLSVLLNDASNPPSQSMSRAIQRHRDVYQDYARELKRTKVCLICVGLFVLTKPLSWYRLMYKQPWTRLTCWVGYGMISSMYPRLCLMMRISTEFVLQCIQIFSSGFITRRARSNR